MSTFIIAMDALQVSERRSMLSRPEPLLSPLLDSFFANIALFVGASRLFITSQALALALGSALVTYQGQAIAFALAFALRLQTPFSAVMPAGTPERAPPDVGPPTVCQPVVIEAAAAATSRHGLKCKDGRRQQPKRLRAIRSL